MIIRKVAMHYYHYSLLKGRFLEGEALIASDAVYTCLYALYVLKVPAENIS